MYKIIVKHSSIQIHGYTLGDCPRLEYNFTIYDRVTHASYLKGVEYIEEENMLILPRGIDIFYLENLLNTRVILDTKCDEYDKVDTIKIKYLPRDEEQKEALRFTIGEGEYRNNKSKSQLCLNLVGGKGKSYVTIMTSSYLCMRNIVITSSLDWLEQWKNYILQYTNIKEKEIYFISGSNSIKILLRKDVSKYKIFLASHSTIRSYGDKYGWAKVSELFKHMKIGMKSYDEAHLYFDNIARIDYHTNTYKTLYITASPERSSEDDDRIYQLYFKNIPSITLFKEDEDPHTHYIAIKYKSHPTPQEISNCKNMYGLNSHAYANYLLKKENYYKILTYIIDMSLKCVGKTLIYISTNHAIERTRDWIIENFPELADEIGIFTNITKKDEKDSQKEKKIILSTTKSCGPAVHINNLKLTFVLAEPFKSKVLAKQSLWRTRDHDTYYIEFVDTSFVNINKYYYNKKTTFSKYALSCKEINLSDIELNSKVKAILDKRLLRKNTHPFTYNKKRNTPFTYTKK